MPSSLRSQSQPERDAPELEEGRPLFFGRLCGRANIRLDGLAAAESVSIPASYHHHTYTLSSTMPPGHQHHSSLSTASIPPAGNAGMVRAARLERKTWIMAIAIFAAVVLVTGSAPYYLSTQSLVSSAPASSSSSSSKAASSSSAISFSNSKNAFNGSWEDELRQTMGLEKCIKPEAK